MLLLSSFSNKVSFGGVYPSLVSALRAQGVFVSGLYVLCSSSWRRRAGDHPGSLPRTSSVGFLALRSGRCRSGCCALWLVSLSPFPGLLAFDFPPSSRSLGMPQGGLLSPRCLASQMRSRFTRPSAVLVAGSRPGSSCRYPGSQKFYVLLLLLFLFFSGAECFWLP